MPTSGPRDARGADLIDAGAVLAWGLPRLRDLPWRRTRDPWAVFVSEVMLQQTQADRVVPKWVAFMQAFPTPRACAAAPLGDVLRLWQGLGYPRRARNVHATAGIVAANGFPRTVEGLLELPGVGQYTARAVLAFAFERDAAVVDTNIARVFARVAGRSLGRAEVQGLADAALVPGDAWAWNQCLMELGALVCRPAPPACEQCPLSTSCAWRGADAVHDPAIGSAAVSKPQARFEGSDRQARGRIMLALTRGPLPVCDVAALVVRSEAHAAALVLALEAEGLVQRSSEGLLQLPA